METWPGAPAPAVADEVAFVSGARLGCFSCEVTLQLTRAADEVAQIADFFADHGAGHRAWIDVSGPRASVPSPRSGDRSDEAEQL